MQPFHDFRCDLCIRRALVLILTGLLFFHARASAAPFLKYSLPKRKKDDDDTHKGRNKWRMTNCDLSSMMSSVHRCRFDFTGASTLLFGLCVLLPFCNLSLVPFGSWYFLLNVAASRSSLAPERLLEIF